MKLRLIAAAILFHGNDVLMMKRSERRTLNPGLWAVVGGHMEGHELSDPRLTCLREIEEETGLSADRIEELQLRYVLLRNNHGELRQQFIYTGRVTTREVHQTDEGELHWIPVADMLERPMPYTFRATLEHLVQHRETPYVWLGSIVRSVESNLPHVVWTPLTDPLT
ncbi:NUDIX domain-containing protein [Paenibacillus koleovorans]|uniref:NUDIX domain-containing protein n=1 Tax=Paenibacillus koleovorans TaxID=121608 RepID=UPI000FDBCACA|nr:NUDIX hydrolase [Paenibacillus koleovorans]